MFNLQIEIMYYGREIPKEIENNIKGYSCSAGAKIVSYISDVGGAGSNSEVSCSPFSSLSLPN